jgi:hypothetical protein
MDNKQRFRDASRNPTHGDAGWSSPVARQAHNLKVAGSNPAPATNINSKYRRGHAPSTASRASKGPRAKHGILRLSKVRACLSDGIESQLPFNIEESSNSA